MESNFDESCLVKIIGGASSSQAKPPATRKAMCKKSKASTGSIFGGVAWSTNQMESSPMGIGSSQNTAGDCGCDLAYPKVDQLVDAINDDLSNLKETVAFLKDEIEDLKQPKVDLTATLVRLITELPMVVKEQIEAPLRAMIKEQGVLIEDLKDRDTKMQAEMELLKSYLTTRSGGRGEGYLPKEPEPEPSVKKVPPVEKNAGAALMYVDVVANRKTTLALVGTAAEQNFITPKVRANLGLRMISTDGWIEDAFGGRTEIHGVCKKVPVVVGPWRGELDFVVVELNNFSDMILGTPFIRKVLPMSIGAGSLSLTVGGEMVDVPVTMKVPPMPVVSFFKCTLLSK